MKNEGTPKTLRAAIKNGIEQYKNSDVQSLVRDERGDILTAFIMAHVRDYLAQAFGVAYLEGSTEKVEKLWKSIFPEEQK